MDSHYVAQTSFKLGLCLSLPGAGITGVNCHTLLCVACFCLFFLQNKLQILFIFATLAIKIPNKFLYLSPWFR